MVQWLRENGCPWGVNSYKFAAEGGQFEMVQWLKEKGCPFSLAVCHLGVKSENM